MVEKRDQAEVSRVRAAEAHCMKKISRSDIDITPDPGG